MYLDLRDTATFLHDQRHSFSQHTGSMTPPIDLKNPNRPIRVGVILLNSWVALLVLVMLRRS